MGFGLTLRSKMRRSTITHHCKEGMDITKAREYGLAIASFSLALENIETEYVYRSDKINSKRHRLDPNEVIGAHTENQKYCDSMKSFVYVPLIIIYLDQGDRAYANEWFNKLKKVDPQGAEELNAKLKTQGQNF